MTNIQQILPMRTPWKVVGFPTKGSWLKAIRIILHDTPHGIEVIEGHNILMSALSCHPDAEEKRGIGVHHFEPGPGPDKFGSTCFYIVRLDGSKVRMGLGAVENGKTNPSIGRMQSFGFFVPPAILKSAQGKPNEYR